MHITTRQGVYKTRRGPWEFMCCHSTRESQATLFPLTSHVKIYFPMKAGMFSNSTKYGGLSVTRISTLIFFYWSVGRHTVTVIAAIFHLKQCGFASCRSIHACQSRGSLIAFWTGLDTVKLVFCPCLRRTIYSEEFDFQPLDSSRERKDMSSGRP